MALSLIKSHPPLLSIDFYPVRTTYKRYMGFQAWIKPLDNSTPTYSRKVALWHALCEGVETILQDSNCHGKRISVDTDLLKFSKLETLIAASRQQLADILDSEINQVLLDIESATHGRRFVRTNKGYFGFALKKCKVGGSCCCLCWWTSTLHCPPIITWGTVFQNSREDLEDHLRDLNLLLAQWYTILGDSYVYGIMDGEVFDLFDEKERQPKEIILV
jgi:hypothetical protein